MAKLKGKKKAAFLARMKRGRLAKAAKRVTKKVRAAAPKRRKSGKKRRKTQSTNTPKRRRSTVAKKRRGSSKSSKFGIPSVVKKVAAGVGLATIATVLVAQVAPQAAPIVRPIAAFIGGGIPGVIGDLLLSGGAGFLGNIFGGGQTTNGGQSV